MSLHIGKSTQNLLHYFGDQAKNGSSLKPRSVFSNAKRAKQDITSDTFCILKASAQETVHIYSRVLHFERMILFCLPVSMPVNACPSPKEYVQYLQMLFLFCS
jgi:hypothetical protein